MLQILYILDFKLVFFFQFYFQASSPDMSNRVRKQPFSVICILIWILREFFVKSFPNKLIEWKNLNKIVADPFKFFTFQLRSYFTYNAENSLQDRQISACKAVILTHNQET